LAIVDMAKQDLKRSMHPSWRAVLALTFVMPFASAQQTSQPLQPAAGAHPAEDGQWVMPAKDYASTRYSELDEITKQNVKDLKVAFTFSTGVARGQESAPIVVGTTMYFVAPYPNVLYALDLTKDGAPLKWKYEPKPRPAAQGAACCDTVNRGPTFGDGKVFYNTLDNDTVALDAETGKEAWRTHLGDIEKGETMTMAPLVVKGKVLVGNSGGEFGVRGWLTALDAKSGKIAWRAYSAGPDSEVLISDKYKAPYEFLRGKDLGITSWPPDGWKFGGGSVWGWISYDPTLDLIYYGTANPGPWNAEMRPGDNLFTSGIFAREPDTGQARWFYQLSPHDLWDHDGVNENVLLDGQWDGQDRKLLIRPERNGFLYVIDRTDGRVLSADPFVPVNAYKGVDLDSGRIQPNDDKKPTTGKVTRDVCPSAPGAKDWNPSAYSPKTGLLYIPHNNLCMNFEPTEVSYIAGTPYVGVNTNYYRGPGGNGGFFTGWDVQARKPRWQVKEEWPVFSGAAATAGGVVFYGTLDGWFKALDADTGAELWKFKTGSGIIGQPTVYRGPDGHQYVAILSGIGGWAGSIVSANLDPRDATAGNGWGSATGGLKNVTTAGGMLYVFALPH
jgi:PQQ-dependent dehydrogenase (methanol/ethanol family)